MQRTSRTKSRRLLSLSGIATVAALLSLTPALQAQAPCEDVSGVWAVEVTLPGTGVNHVMVTLEQSDCVVTGVVEGRNRTAISDGSVTGPTATFTVMAVNQATGEGLATVWEATVDGDEIAGTLSSPLMGVIDFTGRRAGG